MISEILLCFLIAMLFALRWYQHWYWRSKNVPFVPIKFPYLLGNSTSERHQALEFANFYNEHRTDHPLIGIYMFLTPAVLIVDLELIRTILTQRFDHFQNRGMYYNNNDTLSVILGTMEHDQWQPLRARLTPAFTPAKIKEMFAIMKTVGEKLVSGLNEILTTGNELEIRDHFSRFAIDVIGTVAIGIDCDTLNYTPTKLREMAKKAMQPYLTFPQNILTIAYPNFARFWNVRKHPKDVSDFFEDIVKQIIQHRQQSGEKRNDYMQLLIDSNLTTKEITALAFDLLSAGYADSTSTLSYCLYELSLPNNTHIQDRAREEIQSVLKQHNGELTNDALNKMVYLEKIINETLRKHPVAGNVTRIATRPFKVPNTDFTIPKGMRIFIPIYALHHDPVYYENPEEFKPERSSQQPDFAFLPFGEGPRKCIGFRFAKLLIGTGLVSLLQNFKFSTCERTQIPIKYSATKNTLIPDAGVWLKVQPI